MPAIRTAVLTDERGNRLGSAQVPDSTMLIQHADALFIRTPTAIRLSGNGIGIVFSYIEPLVRDQLRAI